MAIFVLIANDVPTTHFEKAIEVQIKSSGKVKFVPQGYHQIGIQGSNGVASNSMQSNPQSGALSNVRFEWDGASSEFGSEVVKALAGHHRQPDVIPAEQAPVAGTAAAPVV